MNDELILVNEKDDEIGFMDKTSCHINNGILHRAFSIFILNSDGKLLIQKRSFKKMLWGGFWSNSCCSHPRRGERIENAVSRRLTEELGISCELKYIYKFVYNASFGDKGSEREVCSVFIGRCDDIIIVNSEEISEVRWIDINSLFGDVVLNKKRYTPWFLEEIKELRRRGEI